MSDGLRPVDISPYRRGGGEVDYVTSFQAATSGPHAAIVALMHGNELCGAHALARLLEAGIRPRRGRLSLIFANVDAYHAIDPADPDRARAQDEDMNRLWSPTILNGPRQSRDLTRARSLRPVFDKVDLLLDLHSMKTPSPPLVLSGILPKGRTLARAIGAPALIVADAGHAAGPRLRDYAGFADPGSPRNAVLVECGAHYDLTTRDVAIEVSLRFLLALGMIDRDVAAAIHPLRAAPAQRVIEVTEAVTVTTPGFAFARSFAGMEVVATAGTAIGRDGEREVVTPYDDCVLVMPSPHPLPGQTAVRFGRFAPC